MSMIGKTIKGTYQVYEKVGQGAVATVYLARDLTRNRIVALKAIHPHLTEEGRFLERFRLEAELLSQVQSPYVIQVYDYGKEDEVNYIVMEYVEGKTLAGILQESGPLEVSAALNVARQIAACLAAMSAKGIVHRDIKPANIMLTPEGQVKIMDFGIAKGLVETGLTQTGVLGTPHYISPEQAEGGRKLDVRSDIYSLGITLFEMLTGQVPYKETSPVAVIMKHLTEPIPDIRPLREDVPEEVDDLVRKCLAKLPERRFQTPEELVAAIDHIQPPELRHVESAQVSEAILQRLEQLATTVQELQARVGRLESQPPPAPAPARPAAEPKRPAAPRAGLLFLTAFVLIAAFFGIMLPRPPAGDVATAEPTPIDLTAQIAAEVKAQLAAHPTPALTIPDGSISRGKLDFAPGELVHQSLWQGEDVCFDLIAALQALGYSQCLYASSGSPNKAIWYGAQDCSGEPTIEPTSAQKQGIWQVAVQSEKPVYLKARWQSELPYLVCVSSP